MAPWPIKLPDRACVLFALTPWSFSLFRLKRRRSPQVTLSLKSSQRRLLSTQQPETRGIQSSPTWHDDHSVHYDGGNTAILLSSPGYTTAQWLCRYYTGQFPSQPTVVRRCGPPARRRAFEGMEVPDYRRVALQYYDAFRGVAKDCWATILDGCD